MTEPEQSPEQSPAEAVTFADEQEAEPAQDAPGPADDVGAHRVNEGL